MLIKDIPETERPRERFLLVGVEHLSNEELLSILIKTGTKERSAKQIALEVLKEVGAFSNLKQATLASLTKIKGLGKVKAIELLASIELGKRIFLEEEGPLVKMSSPKVIWEKMKYLFQDVKQEYFYALYFNAKQELIEKKLLFMGTINRSIVHPREIFKEAYLNSASSIVCIHNHPSGDVNPSEKDMELTDALVEIGKLNNIPIVDHIIVSTKAYYSFCEAGTLERNLLCSIKKRK